MSDFLFCTATGEADRLGVFLSGFLPGTMAVDRASGTWGSLAVARAAHDPPCFVEHGTMRIALAGYPLLHAGGRATRLETMAELQRLADAVAPDGSIQDGTSWADLLDGPFALLAIDATAGAVAVITDLMSFVPAFTGKRQDGVAIAGTHVDAVAQAAGARAIDLVSAVDKVTNESIAHPYTAYDGVRVLEPASVTRFAAGTIDAVAYWLPTESADPPTLASAAAQLRESLVRDVAVALDGVTDPGILFSAGEDARAVLGATPDPTRLTAFMYAEWENREVRLARRAAAAYGSRLVLGQRATDHYLGSIDTLSRLASSHHRFIDVHGLGFHESLGLTQLPVVLGGFSADALLKGEYIGRTPHAPRHHAGLSAELLATVAQRRGSHLERVRSLRPTSAEEWAAMWPAHVRKATGNVQGNRRLLRMHEPYMSSGIVRLAAAVPQQWKRHRRLFQRAMRPLLHASWYVPHVRSRYPYLGRASNLLLGGILNASRGLYDRARGLRNRQSGWTDPGAMVRLPAYSELEHRYTVTGSGLEAMFDEGCDVETAQRSWPPRARLLLRQLVALLGR